MSSESGLESLAGADNDSRVKGTRARLGSLVRSFHMKEEGIEAIETIIILVVAVIILLALVSYFWPSVFQQLKDKIAELFDSSP